jgi:hypothetical protein
MAGAAGIPTLGLAIERIVSSHLAPDNPSINYVNYERGQPWVRGRNGILVHATGSHQKKVEDIILEVSRANPDST